MSNTVLSATTALDSVHVLHVDDEPDFAELAGEYLTRKRDCLDVTTASDASAGLDVLAAESVDCIVSDYEMPGQNGIEFLETVRENHPELPFILFTGKGSEAVASDAFSAGATDYLQKEGGTDQYTVLANKVTNYVEKYRAEQAMTRRAQAMAAADEGIAILDADGRYLETNETYANFLGTTPAALSGRHWSDTVPDDEAEYLQADALPAIEQGQPWRGEVTGRRMDGETFPKLLSLTPLDTGGHVCIVRDISAQESRKQAISSLHQTARRLMEAETAEAIGEITTVATRDILGLPANGMHLYDEQENALVPVAWTDITEDLVGMPPTFQPNESIAWTAFETGEAQIHDDISTVDERYNPDTPVRSQLALPLDDWGVVLVGSPEPAAFDDTDVELAQTLTAHVTAALDRVDREKAIRTSEARYRSLTDDVLDTSAVATFILDAEFNVVWVSEATTEYFGLARETLEGAEKRQLIETNIKGIMDDPSAFAETVLATYDDNTYVEEFECHVLAGDDREERWLKHWSQPIESGLYAGGRIEHYTDITQRKHREQQLHEQNDRLDEFASIVSHDLRNPLTVAAGNLELAREDYESEYLDNIARAHNRMDVLIDDLLTLAQEGETIGETEPVAFTTLVEACWANLTTGEATLRVEGERTLHADRSRVQQLVENLLRNAVEHGGEGVTVTVGTLPDGFYVEDDGPGIPSADRAQVFETGYSTATDGTGFGLSIVNQIVDAHNWAIDVTDGVAGGARFEITGVNGVDC
ncbi:response regulator [Haloparvum sp. AD34]